MAGGNRQPKILRPERTEYGKAIRKQYEAGEIQESRHNMTELKPREDGISNTLTTVQKDNLLLEPKVIEDFYEASRIVSSEGLAPCVKENHGTVTAVAVREATKQGYAIAEEGDSINIQFPNSETRRGRVGKECAHTLETSCNQAVIDPYNRTLPKDQEAITTLRTNYSNGNAQIMQNYRIRKLTPKECWRLMGFTDEEFAKAEEVNSNSQLYKQAGNSIVVDVLEYIFKNLLK
jgi:DNA (cytosine-5)-methyltransferase 1